MRSSLSRYRMKNMTESHIVRAAHKQAMICHIVEFLRGKKKNLILSSITHTNIITIISAYYIFNIIYREIPLFG